MLKTEMRNEKTKHIDKMSTAEMLEIINEENFRSVKAVEESLHEIEKACDAAAETVAMDGRIFYIGAGTSGRLGIADAAECPPTYGVPADSVIGIIAGGYKSLVNASEGEEDNGEAGVADFMSYNPQKNDILIGISAAGGAPYVVKALEYAKSIGCKTVGITSNAGTLIDKTAEISIVTDTGAEVVTGSTRMKAGTARKIVLNMISTCAMIKTGKVYENLMINLRPTNNKLKKRIIGIVREICGCDESEALERLQKNNWVIRDAVKQS